jgi:hypothetical protein
MTQKRRKPGGLPPELTDPMAFLQRFLDNATSARAALEGPARAQAALAADTLRNLNAPMVAALQRQRELAELLAATAKQAGEVAEGVQQLARQHSALTAQFEAALEPYLRYVDWLGKLGAGDDTR